MSHKLFRASAFFLIIIIFFSLLTFFSKPQSANAATISSSTWYTVVNQGNGKCVDNANGGTANGNVIQQWACSANNVNQQWQFVPTSGGNYEVITLNAAGMVWDIAGPSTANGALLHLWTYGGGANQQWLPVALDSTHYKFVNLYSGTCLDVPAASTTDGVQLDQYTCNGTGAQSWTLNAVGGSPTNTPTTSPATNTPLPTATTATSSDGTPFSGTPYAIPGKVEAENYNTGGEGIAYHDSDATNSGTQYRTDGVDIEATTDTGGGFDVGWTATGEWLKYTVNVTSGGTYTFDVRVASAQAGSALHLEVDSANVTGSLTVPNTGAWQTWTDVTKSGINLSTGQHVVRLVIDTGGMNINWFSASTVTDATPTPTFVPATNTPIPTTGSGNGSPFSGTPYPIPGKVEAENYNTGGNGVAYGGTGSTTNQGGQYRTDTVSIEASTDTGGGFDVGWTVTGEWLKYTVNVTSSGTYTFDSRVASAQAGSALHLEVDGANVTGSLTVPNTGGWQTWADVTKSSISLSSGQHVLRLVIDTGGMNVNWLSLTTPQTTLGNIIPMPVSMQSTGGAFTLSSGAAIYIEANNAELTAIGQYLANKLKPSTGYSLPVLGTTGAPANGNIYLTTANGDSTLGNEGYTLTITANLVTLSAFKPTGLFRGIQTIRQLLPPTIDSSTVQGGPWTMATGTIRDYPRFAWRGAMLDVARHFFSVSDVETYIDLLAYYKIDYFHLHLSDDQGWRIAINSWPNLATYGGSTEVGGGPGGYYTQTDYTNIVNYAQSRYITLIPEIDMPGHTNAALASYAALNCNGVAPALYTGTNVGFSSLCVPQANTYTFIDNVIKELAALTPGPYIHIGGDESSSTSASDYITFVNKVQNIVKTYNKQVIGWEDISKATLIPNSVIQHWNSATTVQQGVQQGAMVVMSPATKAYLDMKYDSSTVLGQNWAGYINVQTGYSWDPGTQVSGISASSVLGIEAPLWTETIVTLNDIEYMAFPRVIGDAELGWSQVSGRSWSEYKVRLGAHGPRLTALGVNFYRSAEVPWQ